MDQQFTSSPLVSIIIPFYGTYIQYFEECLQSVINQTYTNWEAIVVDDASTHDEARKTVERFADSRLTITRHDQNRGQAAARNTGLRISAGEFFMPVDCDDILAPAHLQNLVQALSDHPGSNIAYADYRLFSAITGELRFPVRDALAMLREQWIPHPGTVFKRDLWERAGGYCEEEMFRAGNEDWDFFLSITEIGLHPLHVPEPSYYYRQHEKSISSSRSLYSDYLTRELMYVRHRQLFDQFRMKRTFLAGGYRVSAKAFWLTGDRIQALRLLSRAVWLAPVDFAEVVIRRVRPRRRRCAVRNS
jgi:glycosyltransferase involved in cell wall biosynthesis